MSASIGKFTKGEKRLPCCVGAIILWCMKRSEWKARAKAARLPHKELAAMTGYAVPSISRALSMSNPPMLLRLVIVLAETMPPDQLGEILRRAALKSIKRAAGKQRA